MLAAVRKGWRGLVWYVHGVTGESRYAAYVAHERAEHPDREPMTERDFWRDAYVEQGKSAQGRCC